MATIEQLKCRECSRVYPASAAYFCEFCFGPLEPVYDWAAIASSVSRASIASGPPSLWRYADLLPVSPSAARVDLGAGFTPLIRAERLGAELGIDELYLKNDTANPTHSFKDRVVSVALTVARDMGFDTVACASTGNLANAVAAHAAHAGMGCFVFVPDDLEIAKILGTAVYGAHVIQIKGNYDAVNRLCSEIAQTKPWAFVNVNMRPYYAEGSKTIAFEVAEQLGWSAPDHVVVPVASGSLLTKVRKGFDELERIDVIEPHRVALHAAQSDGCSPVVAAIASGSDVVRPVKPNTIVKSLAIGNPADGSYAVQTVLSSGGTGVSVSDEEVAQGILTLASTEGIFTETAGGVTVAALTRLAKGGAFARGERVVALITGTGLKTPEVVQDRVRPVMTIPADIDAFEEGYGLL